MTTFGSISYATVAAAYFLLGVLLAISWKGRTLGGWLIAGCAVTCVWGLILSFQASFGAFSSTGVFMVEVGRSAHLDHFPRETIIRVRCAAIRFVGGPCDVGRGP